MIYTLYLSLFFNLISNAAAVPTQDDVVKFGALKYFQRLPHEGWNRLLHLAKLGTFDLILHQHFTNPAASPFRMFHSTAKRRNPSKPWSLNIRNSKDEYKEILEVKYGLCAGLTMVNRKLQLLAHFDPKNIEGQKFPPKKNQKAWFNFMKNKIDDMISYNKMSIIPNFNSIHEFSSDPVISNYLKEHIIRQWELVSVNFLQGLFQGYAGTLVTMKKEVTLQYVKDLEKILSLGINPVVFLSGPSQKMFSTDKWIHMVQVSRIIKNPNSISLEVWDPNVADPKTSSLVNILDDGRIMFGSRLLAGMYPLRWDSYEIADMVEKNLDFCIKRPTFCTTIPK